MEEFKKTCIAYRQTEVQKDLDAAKKIIKGLEQHLDEVDAVNLSKLTGKLIADVAVLNQMNVHMNVEDVLAYKE